MSKKCPSVARSPIQTVYAVLEDVSGVLQPPEKDGYIVPAGRATMTQTPGYDDSEELSASLNVIEQFQDAVEAGTGSISLYGRLDPDYGKPEGDALFVALMGDYNDPGNISASLTDAIGEQDDVIAINGIVNNNQFDENILAGKFPPRGVISIGGEKILYGLIEHDGKGAALLKACKRNYGNSGAAPHEAGDKAQLLSRVYSQNICRPTCSIYILNDDKLLLFMSGCSITQNQVRLQRESGQMHSFDFQGRRMGWCGQGEVAEPVASVKVQLTKGGADAYTPGGILRNRTRKDDNMGRDYTVIEVDEANDIITLNAAPEGWQAGDLLCPWLPVGKVIGTPQESRFANVEIDGIVGKMASGGLTISCPVTNLLEIGDEYVGEGISTRRSITLDRSINFRAENGREFGRGYRGYELPVTVFTGKGAGLTFSMHMGRVKFFTPELGESDSVVTMTQNGTALGMNGEDSLFIIQE